MFIGLISDTHGVFDAPFREFLSPVDEIWHAGDFGGGFETAAEIAAFKPLVGVCGNCDRNAYALLMRYQPDIFVCGHSHILKVVYDKNFNMMVLNPGAAGLQGFHIVRTALRFHIDEGKIHDMEVFKLDREQPTLNL